jgi:hypothetical protein
MERTNIRATRVGPQEFFCERLCTKTTHVSEWMINSNLAVASVNLEFHQRELVDRSFSLKGRN